VHITPIAILAFLFQNQIVSKLVFVAVSNGMGSSGDVPKDIDSHESQSCILGLASQHNKNQTDNTGYDGYPTCTQNGYSSHLLSRRHLQGFIQRQGQKKNGVANAADDYIGKDNGCFVQA
jgi:hypothetical protein